MLMCGMKTKQMFRSVQFIQAQTTRTNINGTCKTSEWDLLKTKTCPDAFNFYIYIVLKKIYIKIYILPDLISIWLLCFGLFLRQQVTVRFLSVCLLFLSQIKLYQNFIKTSNWYVLKEEVCCLPRSAGYQDFSKK